MKKNDIEKIIEFMINGNQVYYSQKQKIFITEFMLYNGYNNTHKKEYYDISNCKDWYGDINELIKLPLIDVFELQQAFIKRFSNLYLKDYNKILNIVKDEKQASSMFIHNLATEHTSTDMDLYNDFVIKEAELVFNCWYKKHFR